MLFLIDTTVGGRALARHEDALSRDHAIAISAAVADGIVLRGWLKADGLGTLMLVDLPDGAAAIDWIGSLPMSAVFRRVEVKPLAVYPAYPRFAEAGSEHGADGSLFLTSITFDRLAFVALDEAERQAARARTSDLVAAGTIVGLWRQCHGHGVVALWDVNGIEALSEALRSLPLLGIATEVDIAPVMTLPGVAQALPGEAAFGK